MRGTESSGNNMNPVYTTSQQFTNAGQTVTTMTMAGNQQQSQQQQTRKRPHSLDFTQKKPKFNASLQVPSVLDSPDLHKLGLASPDLDRLILNNTTLQTPTPGMSAVFSTKQPSAAQEEFTLGFETALKQLKENNEHSAQQQQQQAVSQVNVINVSAPALTVSSATAILNTMSGGTYTNLDSPFPLPVKEEIQTIPSSPPMSPINMEEQERVKLERKRQRNRVAASKCRKRKLERISKLEDKVKLLKGENTELCSVISEIKKDVCRLKQQVIEHVKSGCTIDLQSHF